MMPDYKETVLKYKDMVYRIAFAQCSCRQDAEDVFQDVFFKLYNLDSDFADEEHLKASSCAVRHGSESERSLPKIFPLTVRKIRRKERQLSLLLPRSGRCRRSTVP